MKTKVVFLIFGLTICGLTTQAQTEQEQVAATLPSTDAVTVEGTAAQPAETEPTASLTDSEAIATEPQESSAVIPIIIMEDALLTDAIKNLARQAGINYMLDPRIAFGQPGPDGKVTPQPVISIRWENVTAEQALNALLNNYNLQMVEDPKTHIAQVTIKDPAAPDPLVTKIIQLKYAGPSNILASAQTALSDPRSKITADVRTSQLVVLATEKEIEALDEMVERLDLPTRQVLIEARLMETSMNPQTIKGIDWSGTLEAQRVQVGNNLQSAPVLRGESDNKPLATGWPKLMIDTAKGFNPATAFLDADGVSAVFSFLNRNAEAKVISAPRTVTLDNETARIDVIRQIPIITTSPSSANTPGSTSISYTNVGVILNVTPRISADDTVNLKVSPEVSRVFNKEDVLSGGSANTVYTFDKRVLSTTVVIPSGNTLVLGGLIQDDTRTGNTKVPGLGDLPLLGNLFRSDRKERSQNNLLIFITPTIVQESDYQPTQTTFLRSPVPQESATKEWSAWDSGKPYDWSKRRSSEPDYSEFSN